MDIKMIIPPIFSLSNKEKKYSVNDSQSLFILIFSGVLAAATVFIAPILINGMIQSLSLSEKDAGLVIAKEISAIAVASLFGTVWLNKVAWQRVFVIAMSAILLGNIASMFSESQSLLITSRVITGLGSGSILALTYAALARTDNPDRNYGLFSMGQLLFASSSLFIFPLLVDKYDISSAFFCLSLLAIFCLIFSQWIPTALKVESNEQSKPQLNIINFLMIGLNLLAIFLFFAAQSSLWSYAQRIGVAAGISTDNIGSTLGVSAIFGFLGASFATFINKKFGRFTPISIAIIVKLIVLYLLFGGITTTLFLIAICCLKFTWNFIIPYQLAVLAQLDKSGRSAVISSFVTGSGLSFGTAGAALLVGDSNYQAIITFSASCCLISYLLISLVLFVKNKNINKV